jgi:hypothetical protein
MLKDLLAGAAACESAALAEAAYFGRTDCVLTLLADGRADPAWDRGRALNAAVCKGHMAVVNALLADGRANPATVNSRVL